MPTDEYLDYLLDLFAKFVVRHHENGDLEKLEAYLGG